MSRPKPQIPVDAPKGTIWFGGPVDRYKISLRVVGDALIPEDVTQLMGVSPDRSHRSGDIIKSPDGKHSRTAKSGIWSVSYDPSGGESWDLESGISALLSLLPSDLSVWSELSDEFEIDVFCGLFLEAPNRGLSLSAGLLRQLGERHIELGLDIYSPDFDTALRSFTNRRQPT